MKKYLTAVIALLFATVLTYGQTKKSNKVSTNKSEYTQETAPTQYIEVEGTRYAYRSFGKEGDIPLVFLIHFVATMDDWDPAVINPLAKNHHIILLDNKGVGGSGGVTPVTVDEMADDAAKVIQALGYKKVNLLGFSLGGFTAQLIAARYPDLVNKLILAGTGPKGGPYTSNLMTHVQKSQEVSPENPRLFLFFSPTESSQAAGLAYTQRLQERRKDDRVPAVSKEAIASQAQAIIQYGKEKDENFSILKSIKQPTLIVNGNNDIMVASTDSYDMVQNIPNAKLVIWSNAGHGGHYQYHEDFTGEVEAFLK